MENTLIAICCNINNELARLLGENVHTIKRYIEILEQAFIIFRLPSFSQNLRKKLGKRNKIYFFDVGIRNTIINNFSPIDLVEEYNGKLESFEFKWKQKKNVKPPKDFLTAYPNAGFTVINNKNYLGFISEIMNE